MNLEPFESLDYLPELKRTSKYYTTIKTMVIHSYFLALFGCCFFLLIMFIYPWLRTNFGLGAACLLIIQGIAMKYIQSPWVLVPVIGLFLIIGIRLIYSSIAKNISEEYLLEYSFILIIGKIFIVLFQDFYNYLKYCQCQLNSEMYSWIQAMSSKLWQKQATDDKNIINFTMDIDGYQFKWRAILSKELVYLRSHVRFDIVNRHNFEIKREQSRFWKHIKHQFHADVIIDGQKYSGLIYPEFYERFCSWRDMPPDEID